MDAELLNNIKNYMSILEKDISINIVSKSVINTISTYIKENDLLNKGSYVFKQYDHMDIKEKSVIKTSIIMLRDFIIDHKGEENKEFFEKCTDFIMSILIIDLTKNRISICNNELFKQELSERERMIYYIFAVTAFSQMTKLKII